MQNLILQRGIDPGIPFQESEGTPGSFGAFKTLELPFRDNEPGISRIPARTYLCIISHMNHLNIEAYQLQSVPGRTEVFIHPGNWAGDKIPGWWSDVEGCILIGHGFLRIAPEQTGVPQFAVVSSRSAFASFMQEMQGQPFNLQIVDPVNVPTP